MTQELINKYFQGDLGRQCDVLYTTVDNRVFIRYEEATKHAESLLNKEVTEWWEEYSGKDLEPTIRGEVINN